MTAADSTVATVDESTVEYLRTWFEGVPDDAGRIVFVRRRDSGAFEAIAHFAPNEVEAAAEFVAGFEDPANLFTKTSLFDVGAMARRSKAVGKPIAGNKDEVQTVIGFAMDVDAGKRDSYADQATVLAAIRDMPVQPTMLVLSGRADCGYHVYWRLAEPIRCEDADQVIALNQRVRGWRDLLCEKVATLLGRDDLEPEKLIDRAYSVDRVLRPVGAVRDADRVVRLVESNPENVYTLEQLTAPGWTPPQPRERHEGGGNGGPISDYLDAHPEITVASLLIEADYTPCGDGEWIRKGSTSGQRSLVESDTVDGVNVMSANCGVLKCDDNDGSVGVGRCYPLPALFVALKFGDADDPANWETAASYARDEMKPKPEESFEAIDPDYERPSEDTNVPTSDPPPAYFTIVRAAELANGDYSLDYLIPGIACEKQLMVVAGMFKSLKTSVSLDMALSLAGVTKFLGRFDVPMRKRVLFLTAESGLATIQETAIRVCGERDSLAALDEYFAVTDRVPRLTCKDHITELVAILRDGAFDVVIADPAYLMLDGADAGNLFTMGNQLRIFAEVGSSTGCTPILVHHAKRSSNNSQTFQPLELSDMAWAGFAEYARQWILLSRRERYVEGTGDHRLWMSVGGSAGHNGCWGVDVAEGIPGAPGGRRWDVSVESAGAVRQRRDAEKAERAEKERMRTLEANVEKLCEAYASEPGGLSKSKAFEVAKLSSKTGEPAFQILVDRGWLEDCEVLAKNRQLYAGHRITEAGKTDEFGFHSDIPTHSDKQ